MGSKFDSFDESPLGAFMQSSLGERGGPQGLVRLIGKNAGSGQRGKVIHTEALKSYILGDGEGGGASGVLLKYTRPVSNTDLGSLDWHKNFSSGFSRQGVVTAPDGDVFFSGVGASTRFTFGVFAGADGAKQFLKDITPDTATGTDWGGFSITKAVQDVVGVGNAIADGEPVVALDTRLNMAPNFKTIPSLAKIDTETGTVQSYKGFPYSSTVVDTRIAQNSTHYFLGSSGFGILKIDKSSLSPVKSIAVVDAFILFKDLAVSEDKVFALGLRSSPSKWVLYCFSAGDLSVLWAKEADPPGEFLLEIHSLAATPGAVYVSKSITKTGKGSELALFKFNAGDGAFVSALTLGGTSSDEVLGISIADKVTTTGGAKSESFTLNQNSIVYMEQPKGFESNHTIGITDVSITTTDLTANQGEVTITSTSADNGATVSDADYGIKIPEYT